MTALDNRNDFNNTLYSQTLVIEGQAHQVLYQLSYEPHAFLIPSVHLSTYILLEELSVSISIKTPNANLVVGHNIVLATCPKPASLASRGSATLSDLRHNINKPAA